MTFLDTVKETFDVKEVDIKTYSPLTLAYIGDAVYDLIIRSVVVGRGNQAPQKLHKATSGLVKAATQAKMVEILNDELTSKEADYYRRGRNAKSYTSAKNASIADYRKATGFEAMIGYLYLTNQTDRAITLVSDALEKLEISI
ncbi:MAG: ribonuclease III [Lachnospiraceae bacterium]|nr:ribonuclease III [Candidatus Colinaster equi]